MTSLTAGIMEAMAKLEHAVIELLGASHEAARDSDSSDEGDSSPQGHAMLNPVLTYGAPTAVGMDQPAGASCLPYDNSNQAYSQLLITLLLLSIASTSRSILPSKDSMLHCDLGTSHSRTELQAAQ